MTTGAVTAVMRVAAVVGAFRRRGHKVVTLPKRRPS